jgi:DeoR/GlpR family transcriptional regulator of sugar metabolism
MKSDRQRAVLEILDADGRVDVPSLAETLEVSEITARRDLIELEEAGYLRRVHGGAVRTTGRAFDRPYRVRENQRTASKQAIAAAAVALVNDGDAIALDVGTTVLQMVDQLSAPANLTIVTANLRTAWVVANSRTLRRPFRLIVSGGVVREHELSMVGYSAISHFETMRVDIAFLGVGGISLKAGLTDYNLEDAELKRVLVGSARQVVVLADSTKIGQENFAQIGDLRSVDLLITDTGARTADVAAFEAAGLNVKQVDAGDDV